MSFLPVDQNTAASQTTARIVPGGCRARDEWTFAGILLQSDRALATAWWTLLVLRGLLPVLFAIAMGVLVAAVQRHDNLTAPLTLAGTVFVLLQVLAPIHHAVGANL